MIKIETFPVYPLGCNCSIVYSEETKDAILVDPGGDEKKILERFHKLGLRLSHIVHTHAHFDHCLATNPMANHFPESKVCLHKNDLFLYENLAKQCAFFGINYPNQEIKEISHFLQDEEELTLGKEKLKVLFTPGHTPGSICFHLNHSHGSILFSGDTLFSGSIGRTDLWGGNYDQIITSIENRLFTLEDETIVIPGHGEETKIYREKRTNPFFT
ncbi:MAG: MBL fold metallo-hydrolase [Leptospiraceae bacterium]|nr:MBL fold metallo-hydrolase [Leptospiraceae bacterium]